MELRERRKEDVDHEYINNVFALYEEWKETKDDYTYQEMAREAIPLVNIYLSTAIRRHNLTGGEKTFDELYSYAYTTFLETVRKEKDYPEPNAFYAYMKTRVSYSVFSYYMDEHVQSDELIAEDEVDFGQMKFKDGVDVSNISEQRFRSYMKHFLSCYNEEEREVFKYIMLYYQQQRAEVTPSMLEVKFGILENRAKELVERGRIIFRTILFFCLKEGSEPQKFIIKKGEKVMVSKYFLTLLAMEKKYPHLTELYALLGDKTHDVIQILGGERVKVPTSDELQDLNKEVSAVLDFLNNPTREGLDEVSAKNNIDRRRLNYILKSYKKKFENVPFIGEELKSVDEVYG